MISLQDLARASFELSELRGRRQKIDRIAALLRLAQDDAIATVARWMTGEAARSRLGIGPAQVDAARAVEPASRSGLDVGQVVTQLDAIARTQGAGSKRARAERLARLFRPVGPMLAQPAAALSDALEALGEPVLEYKLDGARVQVHKQGDEVRVFSRQGNEVTAAVPNVDELSGDALES